MGEQCILLKCGIIISMKTLLPQRPLSSTRVGQTKFTSFSQKQTSDLQNKYQSAITKRQTLARARGAAEAQGDTRLAETYKTMEQQTERSVDRLQGEMKVAGLDATKIDEY